MKKIIVVFFMITLLFSVAATEYKLYYSSENPVPKLSVAEFKYL